MSISTTICYIVQRYSCPVCLSSISSTETDKAWRKEGQKLASTNPRFVSRQTSHLPQVLTSAAITATFGSQLGSTKPSSNVSQGTADSAPAKKIPTSSSQLQNALKFIISQNPLASSKLSDVITNKNQSPMKQQSSPVAQMTSAESHNPPATKITTSPQKISFSTQRNVPSVQKIASTSQKKFASPHKVATSPQKVTTTAQKSAISTQTKPLVSKVKLQSHVLAKAVSSGSDHPSAGKEVKTVSKIESLLCEETLSMDTSPSRVKKSTPSSVKIKSSRTSTVVQSKEESTETGDPKPGVTVEVQTVAKMLSVPLKEDLKVRVQEKKELMDVSPCEEKMSEDKEMKKRPADELTVLPAQATEETATGNEKMVPPTPAVADGDREKKGTFTQAGAQKSTTTVSTSTTISTAAVTQPVTAPPVSVTSTSLSDSLSSVSTTTTVTGTSVSEMSLSSEAIKENRKRSPPLSEAVPPPKKQNIAPLTLSLSQPKPDRIIPKATPIPPLTMPISVTASSPIPATHPVPKAVPTTPLGVEVPSTPLTPAPSIQEFSEFDPTAENLIEALCSDPSNVDDSTLASQLGLDSVDSSVMNLSEFLNIIQPENLVATPQTTDSAQLGSSVSESGTLTKSSTVVENQLASTPLCASEQQITTSDVKTTRTESVPMTVSSTHTSKAPLQLSVTAQILTSANIATAPPVPISTPLSSLDPPTLPKHEMMSTTSVETMISLDQPTLPTTTMAVERTESLQSKQGDLQSSGLLDFTDIGSLLGLEDKLLEDIPEELAESIHALAMLDEKSTRVTWKQ